MTKEELEFKRGYFLAVANIMQTHGEDVIAIDVLRAYGPVDLVGIDSYDKTILRPLIAELKRQAELRDVAHNKERRKQ